MAGAAPCLTMQVQTVKTAELKVPEDELGTVMDCQKPVNTRGFDTWVAYGYTHGYYVINHGFRGYLGHLWLYLAQM